MGHKCIEPMLFIYMVQISIACSYRLYFAINIIKFVPFYRNNFCWVWCVCCVCCTNTEFVCAFFLHMDFMCGRNTYTHTHVRARAAHHPVHTMWEHMPNILYAAFITCNVYYSVRCSVFKYRQYLLYSRKYICRIHNTRCCWIQWHRLSVNILP